MKYFIISLVGIAFLACNSVKKNNEDINQQETKANDYLNEKIIGDENELKYHEEHTGWKFEIPSDWKEMREIIIDLSSEGFKKNWMEKQNLRGYVSPLLSINKNTFNKFESFLLKYQAFEDKEKYDGFLKFYRDYYLEGSTGAYANKMKGLKITIISKVSIDGYEFKTFSMGYEDIKSKIVCYFKAFDNYALFFKYESYGEKIEDEIRSKIEESKFSK